MPVAVSVRSPRAPARVLVGLLVAMVLVASGCSSSGGGDATEAAPEVDGDGRVSVAVADLGAFSEVDVADLAGPGTPLGAGLVVPEHAVLQGAAFPDLVGGGFRALLLLTGDPVAAFDDLIAQAAALGMAGPRGCLGDELALGCGADLVDPADGEALSLMVNRSLVPMVGMVSGMSVRYRPPGSVEGGQAGSSAAPTQPATPVLVPDPVPLPPDADVGIALRAPESPARAIERGSGLVGLPGPCACEGGGWAFVVRLDGVERDVLHGYARQLSDVGDVPDLEQRHRDDVTILGMRIGEGDAVAEIRAVLPDRGESYAIIIVPA